MDNRRSFLTWLGGLFGVGMTAGIANAVTKPILEGFITFHVNVGSLPPFKAEAFIDRLKDQWKKGDSSLIANWKVIWIPTRTEETHAEFYPLNGKQDAEGRLQQIEGYFHEYTDTEFHSGAAVDIDDPKVKSQAIDYVLLMLGAPVVKIELDQQQLDACYQTVVTHIKNTGNAVNSVFLTENFVKDGTLVVAKMILGRVRSKWHNPPGPDGIVLLDGPSLIDEGREEFIVWKGKLEEMM